MRVVACKGKAVARAGVIDKGVNGVLEAAGLADDRNGAVAQRDHLCQAARLKLGRHQEHIGARVNAVSQIAGEHDGRGNLFRPASLGLDEHLLVAVVAGAEHDQANVVRQNIGQHSLNQIKSLLVNKAGDNADNRRVCVAFQTAELQEFSLVDQLILRIVRAVVLEDLAVGLRIEGIHVDAVQDAVQLVAVHAQHGIQAVTVVFGLDLVGVGRGNRGNRSGSHDSGLHQVDVAVHRHKAGAEVCVVNAEHILQNLTAVAALILDVVNGEHGLDVLVERAGSKHQIVVNRNEGGLPVVAVDDIGLPVQIGQNLEHSLGVVRETLCVVVLAVDLAASEVILVVDKIIGNAIRLIAEDAAVLVAPAQTDVSVFDVIELFAHTLVDRRIQRAEYTHVMSLGCQSLRERTCYIAQSTGFDERSAFAGNIHDFHKAEPPQQRVRKQRVPFPHPL